MVRIISILAITLRVRKVSKQVKKKSSQQRLCKTKLDKIFFKYAKWYLKNIELKIYHFPLSISHTFQNTSYTEEVNRKYPIRPHIATSSLLVTGLFSFFRLFLRIFQQRSQSLLSFIFHCWVYCLIFPPSILMKLFLCSYKSPVLF